MVFLSECDHNSIYYLRVAYEGFKQWELPVFSQVRLSHSLTQSYPLRHQCGIRTHALMYT